MTDRIKVDSSSELFKRRLLVSEAKRWVGVKEQGGANKGQIVEMFQAAVGPQFIGQAWCLSFVMFCLQQVDKLVYETISTTVSFTKLPKTAHCLTLWNSSQNFRVSDPKSGHLVLWNYYEKGRQTTRGHIGVIVGLGKSNAKLIKHDLLHTIEGNTADGHGIVREGDGVYQRVRPMTNVGDMRLLGYLNPWK